SVVVARLAACLDDVEIEGRELHAAARPELADGVARDLLPGSHVEQLRRLPGGAARLKFALGQQYVHFARVEVDPDAVPRLQQREPAAYRRFRRNIQDRRAA